MYGFTGETVKADGQRKAIQRAMVPWEEGVQRGHDSQRKRGEVLRKETTRRGREGWVGQERGWAIRGRGTKETCRRIAVIVVTVVVVAIVIVVAVVSRHCCHCHCCRHIHLVLWCTRGCWTKGKCRGAI